MIELRSDTFTLPTGAMREAISRAELGDDVYGEDPTTRRLEENTADVLGKPAACLMPSGTMANLASMLAHCSRGSAVIVGRESDIYVYEAGGASVCGGLVYAPVRTALPGQLDLVEAAVAFPEDPADPQFAVPALLCLENTHNRDGGAVLPLSYLEQARRFADEHGIGLHLDGARLFNASVALGVPAAEIARHADSVQFCLSKGLSAPIGSMVAGSHAFVDRVRRLRKLLGGGMRQAGIIAAAGLVALDHMVERLAEDHANASRLAEGLASMDRVTLLHHPVRTNIVLFRLLGERPTTSAFLGAARQRGLALAELGRDQIRAVTHRGVTTADIDRALDIIVDVLRV